MRDTRAQDDHLPRDQRQFPFVGLTDQERAEVRREIDAAIAGVDRMIRKLVWKR